METWIQNFQIDHDGHLLHIENQATGKVCSFSVKDVIFEPPVEFGT